MNIQRSGIPEAALEPRGETEIAGDGGMNLSDIIRVLRVRRKLIIATAVAVVAMTVMIVLQLTPIYSATAVVMLDERKNNVEDAGAVLQGLTDNEATIQNQVQILTSTELADRVVTKLRLDQDPEFNPQIGGFKSVLKYLNPFNWLPKSRTRVEAQGLDPERAAIVHKFMDNIVVDPIGVSTAMNVSFSSPDPAKAAKIANAIANAYVEDQLEAKFDATQKATQWLSGRIADLARKTQLADQAVQQYKAAHNITETAAGGSVVQQQIMEINGQLVAAQGVLSEKETEYSNLAALAREGKAADSPQVVSSPLISTLRAQEADLMRNIADLQSRYGSRHPKMVDLNAQKANLDSKIAEEIQRIVESAHNDALVASAHVGALHSSLKQIEARGAGQDQDAVQLTALQSTATSARTMYEAFLGRLNQTQGQEGIQTPDARIISAAELPGQPSFPKKALWIELSIPVGIALGLMLAFGAERLDTGFRTSVQIERMLGIPVLGTLPEMVGTPAATAVIDKPMSSFSEAVRGLQLGLSLSNVDRQPKTIVITSSVPGEGKTTLAVSLARLAARSGQKVVLLDGDLRRPNVGTVLGLEKAGPGLTEVLAEDVPLDQALRKDPLSDVIALTCNKPPPNPADLLGSQAMGRLLTNLGKAFDLVIIDSAPVLPVNDTKMIAAVADAVLLVVRWEQTPREAVTSSLRSLSDVNAPVAGVAMTRADTERSRYYSYGYQNYYSYEKYYSN